MTKLKHVAFAGITALAFSQIAFAGGDKQNQSGMQSEPSARQEQQSTAPGVDQATIKQAQEKLSSKGHDVQADGVLGAKTQAAVKEFQQKEGIQASGRLDTETLAALGVEEGSAGTGSSSPAKSGSSDKSSDAATSAPTPSSTSEPTAEPKS